MKHDQRVVELAKHIGNMIRERIKNYGGRKAFTSASELKDGVLTRAINGENVNSYVLLEIIITFNLEHIFDSLDESRESIKNQNLLISTIENLLKYCLENGQEGEINRILKKNNLI